MMRNKNLEETTATMAEMIDESEQDGHERSGQAPKKAYQPPKVVSHHVMEVVAGACTPPPNGPGKANAVSCAHSAS